MSELLTLGKAARLVGVTAKWLKGEAQAGRVPCLPAGSRFLFDSESLTRALAERAAKRESEAVSC